MLALLLLTACFELTETGPGGMVGRVLDPNGMPVSDLAVESIEARNVTDDDGRFAVVYKDPDRFVHFRWQGRFFQRRYRPADDGRVVEIRLPALRDVTVRCDLPDPADAELVWDLGDGLSARAGARCEPGRSVSLPRVPASTPTLTVRASGATLDATLDDRGRSLHVQPPPRVVRIGVQATDAAPSACRVMVDGRRATPAGEGAWHAEVTGSASVTAWCDGRAALPAALDAGATSVQVDWSPTGPDLDLAALAPAAGVITVVRQGSDGWVARVPVDADGVFALPPLSAGDYAFALGDPALLATSPPEPGEPGALRLSETPSGDLVGALRLTGDLDSGTLPVAPPETPSAASGAEGTP